jgi:cellulose synthase operon protein C
MIKRVLRRPALILVPWVALLVLSSPVGAQTTPQPQVEIIEVPALATRDPAAANTPASNTPASNNGAEIRDLGDLPRAPAVAAVVPAAAKVDESALRYYAQQGDMRRLQAEIDRLRAANPSWQPPENLFEAPGVDDSPVWTKLQQNDFGSARAALAELRRANAGWAPSAALDAALQLAELRDRLTGSTAGGDWAGVLALTADKPKLLTCANVDLRWLRAEALARTGDKSGAQRVYAGVIGECSDAKARLSTLQKATTLLDRIALQPLYDQELTRPHTAAETAGLREWWQQYERGSIAQALGQRDTTIDALTMDIFTAGVTDSRDADGARALGWYYYSRKQYTAALPWFQRSLEWKENAETAEGLILTYRALKRTADMDKVLAAWKGRAPNIAKLAKDFAVRPAAPVDARAQVVGQAGAALADKDYATCLKLLPPTGPALSPDGALIQGYCLHGLHRELEATMAFRSALAGAGSNRKLQGDAIFGLALGATQGSTYTEILRLVDTYKLAEPRRTEVLLTALAALANTAFDAQDYHEALRALDRRRELGPETRNLSVTRAWSLYHLGEYRRASALFKQLDQTYSTADTREGFAVTNKAAINDVSGD